MTGPARLGDDEPTGCRDWAGSSPDAWGRWRRRIVDRRRVGPGAGPTEGSGGLRGGVVAYASEVKHELLGGGGPEDICQRTIDTAIDRLLARLQA